MVRRAARSGTKLLRHRGLRVLVHVTGGVRGGTTRSGRGGGEWIGLRRVMFFAAHGEVRIESRRFDVANVVCVVVASVGRVGDRQRLALIVERPLDAGGGQVCRDGLPCIEGFTV